MFEYDDFVKELSVRENISKNAAKVAMDTFLESIEEALFLGKKFRLPAYFELEYVPKARTKSKFRFKTLKNCKINENKELFGEQNDDSEERR